MGGECRYPDSALRFWVCITLHLQVYIATERSMIEGSQSFTSSCSLVLGRNHACERMMQASYLIALDRPRYRDAVHSVNNAPGPTYPSPHNPSSWRKALMAPAAFSLVPPHVSFSSSRPALQTVCALRLSAMLWHTPTVSWPLSSLCRPASSRHPIHLHLLPTPNRSRASANFPGLQLVLVRD
jgi:hypothetical protein